MAEKLPSREVDYAPVCPHCNEELGELHWRSLTAVHAEYVFVCPKCHKVLGIGVRKAGWMG